MKYGNVFFAIVITLLAGCIKEQSTIYTATLTNTTQHQIKILFYKGGIVYSGDTVRLSPSEKKQIAYGHFRGLVTEPGFFSNYTGGPNDSTIVVFDDLYKMTHFTNTPNTLALKYYLFSSLRNILNPLSYRFETHETSKNSRENDHYYDFVEQDYLDAR